MTKICFEDRAVGFIDVLGFSALVNKACLNCSESSELQAIIDLLENSIPSFDNKVDESVPIHLIPNHIYISDCIILSAPLSDVEVTYYDGLNAVVMRTIQLTHLLLKAGYLVRGGISIGKAWHGDSNIVGPAYQEAYGIECNGNEPCVILSDSAQKHWEQSNNNSRMCIKFGNQLMVNGLHEYYIENNHNYGEIDHTFEQYERIVAKQVVSDLPDNPKKKWFWFQEYLNKEKQRIVQ